MFIIGGIVAALWIVRDLFTGAKESFIDSSRDTIVEKYINRVTDKYTTSTISERISDSVAPNFFESDTTTQKIISKWWGYSSDSFGRIVSDPVEGYITEQPAWRLMTETPAKYLPQFWGVSWLDKKLRPGLYQDSGVGVNQKTKDMAQTAFNRVFAVQDLNRQLNVAGDKKVELTERYVNTPESYKKAKYGSTRKSGNLVVKKIDISKYNPKKKKLKVTYRGPLG